MVSHGAMIHQPTLSQIVQKIDFFSKGNPFQIPMLLVSTISRKGKGLLKRVWGSNKRQQFPSKILLKNTIP
jgi:hypothetical protein